MQTLRYNSKFAPIIFLTLLIFSQGMILSPAAAAQTGVINSDVVNIRSGPGADYSVAGQILQDAEVEILQTQGEWDQIRYGTISGWIRNDLITQKKVIQLKVTEAKVNLRSGPATTNAIVAELAQGDLLTLLDVEGEWYKVQTSNGKTGYIRADLAANAQPAATASQTTTSAKPAASVTSVSSTKPTVTSSTTPTVILNGSKLSFEVSPVIENGRTMVPLRAIFEAMGAAVDWNNNTRTVTAQRGSTTVVLPVNSLAPTINGKACKLDVPAKIVNSRTLAPLRFVGEAFGGTVAWNATTSTVTIAIEKVTPASSDSTVTVTGAQLVNLRSGPSTSYDKVDTATAGESLAVIAQKDGWYQVSRSGGRTAWIAGWLVNNQDDQKPAVIPAAVPAADAGTTPSQSTDSTSQEQSTTVDANDINTRGDETADVQSGYLALSTRRSADGYRLVMKTADVAKPEITETQNGQQILYTFKNVQVSGGRDEAYFTIGTGKNARISIGAQTVDDTTWVTIEMPLAYQYTTTTEANGCKQVFTIPSQLTDVQNVSLSNGNQTLVLHATSALQYQEFFQNGTLTVTLPQTGKGFARDSYAFSGIASGMTLQGGKDGQPLQVKIATGSNLDTYQVNRSLSGDMLSVILVNKNRTTQPATTTSTTPTSEKPAGTGTATIFIDPGHGGSDTGAISKDRTLNEKDVTLAIGLKVRDILKNAGYHVVMSRETDILVGVNDIPARANKANADLSVSIHCDSVLTPAANGTGTFYYAPDTNAALKAQEYQRSLLADLLQKAMLEKCSRADRGIRQANYAVLRESNMPSALVETAFISNPTEAALLGQESFQTKAAEAIAAGIQKYVKLML